MDEKLVAQLKSLNPNTRKQAMLVLAKTGDKSALPWLKQIYLNDPEPVLREFAKQAALQIRARLEAQAETPEASLATLKPQKLRGAERRRQTRVEETRRERGNLIWVGLLGLIIGAGVLWLLLGQQILRVADESSVQARIAEASPLSLASRTLDAPAEGRFYHTSFDNGAGFYLQEAQGVMPAEGWVVLVGVFTGTGEDALGWLTRSASENNWLLLTPYFPAERLTTASAQQDLRRALEVVRSNYRIREEKLTGYGYGLGANLLLSYTAELAEFRLLSLAELSTFPQMPNRRAYYYVVSAQNAIPDVTVEFMSRLGVLGIPVEGGVLVNIDDAELQNRQLARTIELIKR